MAKVDLKRVEAMKVVAVEHQGPVREVGEAFSNLFSAFFRQGLMPAGLPLAVFFAEGEEPDLENMKYWACLPVAEEAEVEAPLMYRELPAIEAASVQHQGPYDTMGEAYQALHEWIEQEGYTIAGPPREVYVVAPSPQTPVKPSDYVTEVQLPVTKA